MAFEDIFPLPFDHGVVVAYYFKVEDSECFQAIFVRMVTLAIVLKNLERCNGNQSIFVVYEWNYTLL